jgi:CheY-like chemotaxis protein
MRVLVAPRTHRVATDRSVPAHQQSDRNASSEDARQKTILFVDDVPSILAIRRFLFEALGYFVLTADSGPEALALLHTHAVDAVVLDYLMSPMNGEAIARNIRKDYGRIPIVLSSGCPSLPQSLLEIVDAYIEKGGRPETLIEVLKGLLTLRVSCRQ